MVSAVLRQTWVFLLGILLAFSAWAYGGTRPWTYWTIAWMEYGFFSIWLTGKIALWQRPGVPWPVWLGAIWILAQGGWMAFNAVSVYYPSLHVFWPAVSPFPHAPGGVDRELVSRGLFRMGGVVLTVVTASSVLRSRVDRDRLFDIIVLVAGSLLIFGLVQRLLQAPMIFWEPERKGSTFFATFFYHANAGAYINLVIPVLAAETWLAFRRGRGSAWQTICLIALASAVISAFVNVSKAAMAVSALLLVVLGMFFIPKLMDAFRDRPKGAKIFYSAIAVVALTVLFWAFGLEKSYDRWKDLAQKEGPDGRWLMYSVCAQIIQQVSGFWGFGPGTFQAILPHYTHFVGDKLAGIWRYAHNDYLQGLIEWGVPGVIAGTLLIGGAMIRGLKTLASNTGVVSEGERGRIFMVLLALLGVALHSAVDFPLQISSLQLLTAVYCGYLWRIGRV